MATETIYVYLLDEGVDCWRPIDAVNEGEGKYRIVSVNSNRFSDGEGLVAVRRASTGQ